jgi:hypothetical protein
MSNGTMSTASKPIALALSSGGKPRSVNVPLNRQKWKGRVLTFRHSHHRTRCPKAMPKVITHPLLVRPLSATRGLIGVVPNQIAAAYNASSCQVRMSNVKRRPLMFSMLRDVP